MKKYIISILLPFALAHNATANDVIIDKNGVSINNADIELLLSPAPVKVQLDLLKKKANFEQKLQELYLTKAIAKETKKQTLTPIDQAELDQMLNLFYFNLKIKQLSEQNLPDFEPLAAVHYKGNKEKYVEPAQVAVEHILLDTSVKYKPQEAQQLAKDLIKQLQKGANFEALALKYSSDPAVKENKGKLGLFPKGKMLKAFEDVAYNLKLNEVSPQPVETKYGYHILRKYDQKPSAIKDYAAAKEEIIAQLKHEYIQNRITDFYTKVKADNAMKIDEKVLGDFISTKTKQLEAELKKPSISSETK